MKKVYIVRYSEGSYEDYVITDIFVTLNKEKAKGYTKKFNDLLSKLKNITIKYILQ